MIINSDYLKANVNNFLKETTKIFYLNDNTKKELYNSKDFFDLIVIENMIFDVKLIKNHLKSLGHLICFQNGVKNFPNFNLENQSQMLEENSFKIVKCNQEYDLDANTETHHFFIIAKNK